MVSKESMGIDTGLAHATPGPTFCAQTGLCAVTRSRMWELGGEWIKGPGREGPRWVEPVAVSRFAGGTGLRAR